jgi:itaconate CoA-transferase
MPRRSLADVRRPLDGIIVVSLEQAVAAPLCTRHLADIGARVIKIERPGTGDFARAYDERARGLASHFVWINRSKESLTLDLKHPRAAEVMERLVAQCDVLVENLAPGAAARLGLSGDALRPRYPRLIVCDMSGYGLDGPYRDKKAYDLLIQAEAGLLSVTGTAEQTAKAGISIADIAAGMYAYSNILAALIQRGQTGQGCQFEVAMLDALCEWMGYPLYYSLDGAPPPARAGAAHATIFPYGPFRAGDGKVVMLGIQNEREWDTFCRKVLARPELATDDRYRTVSRRAEDRALLTALIEDALAPFTAQEVIACLEEAQIANARMNEIADVWAHPQLSARGRWRQVATPAGPLPALLPPSICEPRMDPVPALGQHTEAILGELGFSGFEIRAMRQEGAI